jgi:hypothetical protein
MKVPDGTDYVEYMLVTGKVDRKQLGTLHHAALLVPDMQQALETLRERPLGWDPAHVQSSASRPEQALATQSLRFGRQPNGIDGTVHDAVRMGLQWL